MKRNIEMSIPKTKTTTLKIRRKFTISSSLWQGIMFFLGMLATFIILNCFPSFIMNASTFYNEPDLSYSIDKPIQNWDKKRHHWLNTHPSLKSVERVMMVTGSQPKPCTNPDGDHLLLRLFKNKVDYCRIHGHDIFYNNDLLHPEMSSYWAKYPLVKAAMVAHPEAEWIWWVDSDAVFTDMDFDLPLEKYKDHNLVVYGWPGTLYKEKLSMGLNAGVFLIRNCQWSMDLLDRWASFGPQTKDYARWGEIQRAVFSDKRESYSDDQSALCYMILKEKDRWADKFYLETEYTFQGYFMDFIDKFENVTSYYAEIERKFPELRKMIAEKYGKEYRGLWKEYLEGDSLSVKFRRPFVTHFTGCELCSGERNPLYSDEQCWGGMERALNFGDRQVLRNFGYTRSDLSNTSSVEPL